MERLLEQSTEKTAPETLTPEVFQELSPVEAKIHKLADEIIELQKVLREGGHINPEFNEHMQNIIELKLEIVETLRDIAKLDSEKDILEINSKKMYVAKIEENIHLEESLIPKTI